MQNEIAYSRPVTLTNILKFAVPTIAMSVFMSFYTMVDGLFVSNLIGTSALSALNLVYPVIALVTAISTMLATGGSAAIMRKMGEGKPDEAKQDFTFLILVNVLTGLVMCGLGYLFMGKIFGSMSLSPEASAYCWEYLSRYLLFTVPILLMNNFTLYMIAAGKASLSLLRRRRRDQYRAGLPVYRRFPLGDRRGGGCHRPGVLHHSHRGPAGVLQPEQSAPFCQAGLPAPNARESRHERLL